MTTTEATMRKRYLDGDITHVEFYREAVKRSGVVIRDSALLAKVREAIAAGDKHLNTIPLAVWDSMAFQRRVAIGAALKTMGDFYSMAGGVCVMKMAASDAATVEAEA